MSWRIYFFNYGSSLSLPQLVDFGSPAVFHTVWGKTGAWETERGVEETTGLFLCSFVLWESKVFTLSDSCDIFLSEKNSGWAGLDSPWSHDVRKKETSSRRSPGWDDSSSWRCFGSCWRRIRPRWLRRWRDRSRGSWPLRQNKRWSLGEFLGGSGLLVCWMILVWKCVLLKPFGRNSLICFLQEHFWLYY